MLVYVVCWVFKYFDLKIVKSKKLINEVGCELGGKNRKFWKFVINLIYFRVFGDFLKEGNVLMW